MENFGKLAFGDQILADGCDHQAGRADVLLDAAVDHGIVVDVHRSGQEIGGDVRDQRKALGVGQLVILGTENGVVLADVEILGILRELQIAAVRDIGEVLVFTGGRNANFSELLGFFNGLLGPAAGVDIDTGTALLEVHGDHGEIQMGTAVQEKDLVILRDTDDLSEISFSGIDDILEHFGAMAHLHDRHTAALVVEHVGSSLLQHLYGQNGRTSRKIVSAMHNL